MPLSMPYAMIAGPATWAAEDTTTAAAVSQSLPCNGFSSEPSSRRERRRIWRDSAFE